MNFDKITHKTQETIERSAELARSLSHQEVDLEHLCHALLTVDESLAVGIPGAL